MLNRIRKFKLKPYTVIFTLSTLATLGLAAFLFLRFTAAPAKADSTIGFNEGQGITVSDSSGTSAGTITGAVWKTEGLCHSGSCLYFDGSGDYVSFGDDASLDFAAATNFTVNLWFRHTGTLSGTQVLVAKYASSTGYKVYLNSSGYACFDIGDGTHTDSLCSNSQGNSTSFADASWHFVSAVKTGTSRLDLYLDGRLIASKTSLTTTGTLVNAGNFYVGVDGDGSSNAWMGFIDDLKVYTSSARSSDEIKTDYTGQTTSRGVSESFGPDNSKLSNGLVGYWKMDSTTSNIGETTVLGADDLNNLNLIQGQAYYLPTYGTIQSLSMYVKTPAGANLQLAIYDDSNGVPNARKAYTNTFAATTGWNTTLVTSPTTLTPGTYWLVYTTDSNNIVFQSESLGSWYGSSPYTFGTMPTTFPNTGIYTDKYHLSFYATLTGVDTSDASGNSNIIRGTGSSPTSGKFGPGGSFTAASSQFQYATDSASLSITGSLSLSGWINPSSNTASTQYSIAGKWSSGTESYLLAQYGDEIRLYLGSSSNYAETTSANLATGTWYHIVATYSAADQDAKIYVNGSPQAISVTGTIPSSLSDTAALFDIGADGGVISTLDKQVSASADDAFENHLNTGFSSTGTSLRIFASNYTCDNTSIGGFRFTSVPISNSATITSSNFQVYYDSGAGDADYNVYAENVDNSANFSTTADVADRYINTATSATAGPYIGSVPATSWYGSSIDISSVIRQIINRSGWTSGNALTILAAGNCTTTNNQLDVLTYDGNPSQAANLHIEYISPNPTHFYDGAIDDVRLYNRALSPAEVTQLYGSAPGPVAYWKLDEGSGTTAYDSSVNGNTGTITAGTGKYVSGKFGDAYYFDNAATVINAGSGSTLDNLPSSGMTLSGWIYPKGAGENSLGFIMAKNVGTTPSAGWVLRMNSTTSLTFTVDGSTDLVRTTNTSMVTQNAWNYVTVTWDGVITTASSVHIFINGVEATYATTTNGASRVDDSSSTFYIGNDSTSARTFNGYLDDLKVYNYVRSSSQITQDMNAGHPAPGSPVGSPLIWWNMDSLLNLTTYNSGSGGSPFDAGVAGSNQTPNGRVGSAILVNATGHIQVYYTNLSFFDGLSSMTLSFWIQPSTLNTSRLIVSKTSNGGQESFRVMTDASDSTNIRVCIAATTSDSCGNYFTTSGLGLANNAWTFVTIVYDGSQSAANRIKVYKNANPLPGTLTGTIPASMTTGTTSDLDIGENTQGTTLNNLAATFDEFKLYTSALTADQVALEYNQGKAQVWGTLSDTSGLTGGGVASSSAAAAYCIPGDTSTCRAPIHHWKLDDNSGQYVTDSGSQAWVGGSDVDFLGSSASNTTDDPTWDTGKIGQGLKFNGSQYVTTNVNVGSSLNSLSQMTMSAWVRRRTTSSIIEISKFSGQDGIAIEEWSDSSLNFYVSSSTGSDYDGCSVASALNDTNWHYVTLRYDGSQSTNETKLRGFIDGQEATATCLGTVPSTTPNFSGTFYIGAWGGDTTDGWTDDVRIYDYARTPAQIQWDYNRGLPIAWWRMDDNVSGNNLTLHDASGNSLDSTTHYGANTTGMDCTVAGKINLACSLDGTDDYISSAAVAIVGGTNQTGMQNVSWGAWVYPTSSAASKAIINKDNEFLLFTDGNSKPLCATFDYNSSSWNTAVVSTSSISTSAWSHIMCTYDGTNLKIYVNGIQTGSRAQTSTFRSGTIALYLGQDNTGSGYSNFSGRLDDVRIYRYGLTPTQIKTLYANGAVSFN